MELKSFLNENLQGHVAPEHAAEVELGDSSGTTSSSFAEDTYDNVTLFDDVPGPGISSSIEVEDNDGPGKGLSSSKDVDDKDGPGTAMSSSNDVDDEDDVS